MVDAVMESTGSYWKPVYNVLEGRFALVLANAHHVKAVPGRKTDVKDAQWLAELHAHGLVSPSFVPDRTQRGLRELTRTRSTLVGERARLSNRIQKVLEEANIKLASVATDVLGASGRAMLRAMVEGERSASRLADMAKRSLRRKLPELEEALEGDVRPHHRIVLGELLKQVESLDGSISRLESAIEEAMRDAQDPFESSVSILDTIHGAGEVSARALLAEIGTDMSRYGSAARLSAWTGVVPGDCQSGGKRLSTRIRKGDRHAKSVLVQIAHASLRRKDSYLRALYERIARRRGKKKAIIAVAHSICCSVYHMLDRGEPYRELGANYFDERRKAALTRSLSDRLAKLGYVVELREAEVA